MKNAHELGQHNFASRFFLATKKPIKRRKKLKGLLFPPNVALDSPKRDAFNQKTLAVSPFSPRFFSLAQPKQAHPKRFPRPGDETKRPFGARDRRRPERYLAIPAENSSCRT